MAAASSQSPRLVVRQRREELVRCLGRFDPVPAAADRGKVEVLGRVDRDLIPADRAAVGD
jgi:hypothetical protein